jgi:hypothetical protein
MTALWSTAEVSISEPATLITDYILAGASLTFGLLLLSPRASGPARRLWIIGFMTAAAAAAIGGTYHGFVLYFSEGTHRSLWNVTVGLIGASTAFMISAAVAGRLNRKEPHTKWLTAGLLLSLGGIAVQQLGLSLHPEFNHNDLYHCIQTVALFLFFKGAQYSG